MRSLATIGYEQTGLADFIVALTGAGVKQLIDVREVPISRKRGFSKYALSEALGAAGISYAHFKALGDPKPGREAARRGDRASFLAIYHAHLATADATAALEEAGTLAANAMSCLMCFERDYLDCHRNVVAEALADRAGFKIRHLRAAAAE
jgi:uncharacterized protein (DUF488 family)